MDPQPPNNNYEPAGTPVPPNTRAWWRPTGRLAIILGAVLLLVALLLGLALSRHSHDQSTVDIEAHKYEAVIVIDSHGYTPGTVTVRADTEVFFENHDKNAEDERGAANAPSHLVLQSKAAGNQAPGFNSGRIVGDSGYGYVFRTPGTYHFFDADTINDQVTVIVTK